MAVVRGCPAEGLTGRVAGIAGRIGVQVQKSVRIIAVAVFASMACVTDMTNTPSQCRCNAFCKSCGAEGGDPIIKDINYCPMHSLAPRMFECLQEAEKLFAMGNAGKLALTTKWRYKIDQIIAEIEGRSRCYLCGNNTVINYECQECGAKISKK